ncbi:YDG domain-containing protein [Parafilimonas terrae]|uniref:Autotransporter adhesin n=1 Tax=Parafilimonas terrae TaxID=1465490 RepID=A0A1I5WZL3_9BACT|nr:YDG domain-containing protein [Parafilimonas terrae]SFQ25110.1 Autotransporter adhesin [Parafilimonas terrae]
MMKSEVGWGQTTTFSTPGAYNYIVPAGVTSIKIEAWGGGGGGASAGGGGGAYSSVTLNVVPNTIYNLTVGSGGDAAEDGGNSRFRLNTTTLVEAGGGKGAQAKTTPGAGGAVVTGIGYKGGNGGGATGSSNYSGGGGGGSAFNNANGNNGADAPSNAIGGIGGSGTGNGGNGASRSPTIAATVGSQPGGGGGGRASNGSGSASGADGRVVVTVLYTPTSTTVAITPSSSIVYGTSSITFNANVSPNPSGGTVQFKIDGNNAGSPVTVSGGNASLTYNPGTLAAGTHTVTAVFNGNGPYASSTSSGITLTVTKKPITITGILANSKPYNGNTTATFTGATSADIINSDIVTYTVAGTFSDKNVGNGKTVTLSGVTLGGTGAGNYSVSSYPATVTANITPKTLTANSTVASKVYDGNAAPGTVTLGTVTGLVGSETLIITPSAANYANANVGTGKATTISYSLADGTNGGLAANYTMTNKSVTGTVTARPITVTASANTKGYDGTTAAAAIPALTAGTLIGTDALNFTETYDNKNAGTGKTLIPSGTVNDGNGGNNYTVTLQNNTTGVITKHAITVTATANTKTYDGDVTAAAAPVVSGTIFSGDIASFTETYDNKNAGSGKTLTPGGSINDGNSGGNYDITFVSANTGVINQRPITVTAVTNTKPYDGNTSAAGIPTLTPAGALQPGDVANFIETYVNQNAGTGKTLTPSGTVNDGNGGNNYTYTYVNDNTGVINSLVLTYVATPVSRVYGDPNPPLSGTVTGFISGENISNATTGTLMFATTADITSPVGTYPITGSGLTANNGNYTFAQAAGNATAFTVTKANLTITPNNQTKCAGSVFTFAGTEFTTSGLVNSDAVTSVTLTSTGSVAGAAPGVYPIVASAAVGTGLGNYNITYSIGSTLTVNARPTAQITSDNTAICNPGTVHITGTVTAAGEWTLTLSDNQTATGTENGTFDFTVSPSATTTYTLILLSDANCTSTSTDLTGSTTVTVNEPVVITTQPDPSQKVCGSTNSSISFSVVATGSGLTYQWYKNDIAHPVTGATSATYTIPNPVAADAGNYFVVVSGLSPCGTATSDYAELIVNQPITISQISPLAQTICKGDPAVFSVTATGTGLSFFWQHDGTTLSDGGDISIVSDAASSTLTISPTSVGDAGTYHLIVNGDDNVCAQAVSSPDAILTVNKKSAKPISVTASKQVICAGESTVLTLIGGGGGTGETIHWYTGPNGSGTAVTAGNGITVNPGSTTTYYGRYEDGSPCNYNSPDASITITVNPVSVSGTATMTNPEVCYGSVPANDITLSSDNVGTIQWQKSTTLSFASAEDIVGAVGNTLTASQIGTLTQTTYFRAKVTSGICSEAYSNVITITVNPLPTVVSVSPGTSCGGDVTISATASAGATIDWYTTPTGGIPVATGTTSYSPTISATTTFYAEARDITTGCISTVRTPVTATYKSKPDVSLTPGDPQTVCSGSPIADIVISNPNNTTGTTFTLFWDNNNVTGINSITGNMISGTVTNITNIQQTIHYTVTPDAYGCTGNPLSVTVFVNPKPTVSVTSAPTAVCYNTPIAINYTNPNNVSGTVLTWSRTDPSGIQAGPATSGTNNINQTLVNTTTSNITVTYTLRVTSPNGCYSEITKDVILYAEFKSDGFDITHGQTICLGATPAPLTVLVPVTGGSGSYSYQWERYNTSTSGPWTSVGNLPSYSPGPIGLFTPTYLYRLIVTDNTCGSSATSPITSVVPGFGVELDASPLSDPPGPLCSGSSFQMNVKTKSLLGIFGINNLNFSWNATGGDVTAIDTHDNIPLPQNQSYGYIITSGGWFPQSTLYGDANFTVTNNSNATIYPIVNIAASNGNCVFTPTVVNLTVYPLPTMQQPTTTPICSGSAANIVLKGNITDAPTTFTWTTKVLSGVINTVGVNGSIGSGSSGPVAQGTAYTLNTAPAILTNTGGSPATVQYTITPSANGCSDPTKAVTIIVTVNPAPTVSIQNPSSVCSPATVDLTANAITTGSTSGLTYTYWINAGATAALPHPDAVNTSGTYYIKGTSSSGCYDIEPVHVVINPQIPVSVSITNTSSTIVCAGDAISFSATPNNGGISPTYQWQVNEVNVAGATGSSFSSSTLANGDKVRVILTSNGVQCATGTPATSNEITVTVNPNLPVSVAITSDETTICAGGTINFTATAVNGGANPAYQWYRNGNPVSGANSSTFSPANLANNDIVTVKVNSNSAGPCVTDNPATSNGIQVTVNELKPVSVSVTSNKTAICAGETITFTATPTNGGTVPIYQWKVNGVTVGTNSNIYSSNTWTNNDVVTCVLSSDITPCATGTPATSDGITVTIKPDAVAGNIFAPTTNLCVGGPTYNYIIQGNNTTGSWSSSDNSVFTVDATGKVTAHQAGTAFLRYSVTNDCSSDYTEVLLTVGATPAKPSVITGTSQICFETSGFTYSVVNEPGLTYNWSVPSGWTFTGQGTNEITITSAITTGGSVSVTATTAAYTCGISPVSTLLVNVIAKGTWIGITDNWNEQQNWCNGVPTSATDVVIPSGTPHDPVIYPGTTAQVKSLTINGASLTMNGTGNLNINTGGTFTNNAGTFVQSGTGVVTFIGTGKINGTATTFNNITMNGQLTLTTAPTITGIFQVNSGAVITYNPIYTNTSTLVYNVSGSYTTSREWFSGGSTTTSAGDGVPQNVIIQNGNVTINTTGATNRCIAGNLQINSTASLNPNTSKIYILGSWTNNGLFIHSNREVTFDGFANQTLKGNTTFYDLTLKQTGGADLIIAAPITKIDRNLTVTSGTMKPDVNTTIEFTGNGNLDGGNNKAFYDLQIDNTSHMTIVDGAVTIDHNFVNNGTYTYSGSSKQTTFSGSSGVLQSFSGVAGSSTTFGALVVGDNHPLSTGITLAATNNYTIQGGSISLSHSSTLNNTGNTVTFSNVAATVFGPGNAYFHDAITNVSLNPGSDISTFNNYLQINTGGSLAVNSPKYGPAATLIYNTVTPSFTTGLEWNANSATLGLGQPFNVTIQNTNNIVMDGDRTVPGTLNIGSVNTLSLNDQMLTVNTAISGAGSLTGSQLSGLTLGGAAPALSFTQTDFGNYLKTFTLNSGSSATLANALNIAGGNSGGYGILTANGNLTADDNLTLKSDAAGTAMVGESYGKIDGTVTVERFIPGRRAWRFLNLPFASSGQTLHSSWQENQQNTDLDYNHNQNNTPGFGTHITGDNNMSKGYDYNTTSNSSLKTWDIASQSWSTATPSTLTTNVTDHTGYCVFVRGSRIVNLALANNAPTDNTVLRSKGQLFERGIDLNTITSKITDAAAVNGKWVLFGNPFAATIDVMSVLNNSNSTGIDKTQFSVWDPKLAGSSNAGAYVTYSGGIWAPDDGDNTNGSYSSDDLPLVQSGQAFMVEATGSNPQLEFKQANKVTSTQLDVFGIKARKIIPVIYTNLMTAQGATGALEMVDGVASGFGKDYIAFNDPHNANKLWNFGENIALARNGKSMSIEFRPVPTESDTLFYNLYLRQQPYTLKIFTKNPVGSLPAKAWLIDKYLNKQIDVNLSDTLMYSFTPNSDTNSYRNRFMLVFKRTDSKAPVAAGIDTLKNNESIYVYPNPVINKKVMVKFNNLIKGNYAIVVSDMKGRQIRNYKVQHAGGNITYEFMLGASLTSGNYSLTVYNEDTKKTFKVQIIIGR